MKSALSSTLIVFGALALSTGCSTTVAGGQGENPDAAAFEGFPDAEPQQDPPDAAPPQALPCVEGDVQVSDPADDTCYMLFNTLSTWQAAQAACITLGATLTIVEGDAEQTIVAGLSANFPPDTPDLWLGATDEVLENSFVWVDGTLMVFDKWRLNEPNNNGPGELPENCVVIEGDTLEHEWDDRSCELLAPYICERAP